MATKKTVDIRDDNYIHPSPLPLPPRLYPKHNITVYQLCLSDASIRQPHGTRISLSCSSYNPAVDTRFPVGKVVTDMPILWSLKRVRIPFHKTLPSRSASIYWYNGYISDILFTFAQTTIARYRHLYLLHYGVPCMCQLVMSGRPRTRRRTDRHLKILCKMFVKKI